jgi:outer membrane protein assembly factor BamA
MIRLQRWLISLVLLLPLSALGQAATDAQRLIVEDLSCRGNAVTSCDFILGHVYLAPGDAVDEEELGNARLRLASLPSFHSVEIYLEKGSARGRVRVVIEVTEADPYAREWITGSSLRFNSLSHMIAGRLTHQNLFGAGKFLDATVLAYVPLDGRVRSEYSTRVQYVDPHWLGSKRTFATAAMSGGHSDFETFGDDLLRQRLDNLGFDVALGRRIFDFSYVSLFYRYNAIVDVEQTRMQPDGSVARASGSFDNHAAGLNYGWNSEDDPYFPTRGSRAALTWFWASTAHDLITDGGFRKTWTTRGGTSWLIQVADTPGTEYRGTVDEHFGWMAGVARPIVGSDGGEVRRGRWYIQLGYSPYGHNVRGERQKEYGLKVGVRLETRSFGIAEFYFIGSGLHTARSDR